MKEDDNNKTGRMDDIIKISYRLLEIANRHTQMNPLLKDFQVEVMNFTGCDSVGIRVLDEMGNIPYQTYKGFSKKFYETESPLSIKSDQCMCINVIKGDYDPQMPFYTEYGSFYMNGTTKFLSTVTEDDKGSTRNMCNQSGYESVALIPIRIEEHILGLIHIADHRENKVPIDTVGALELAGMQLSGAMQRVLAEEELRKHRDQLVEIVENRTAELTQANKQLRQEIAEREKTEKELYNKTNDLGERVKEMECLYGITGLMNKPGVSLEEVLKGAVGLIPLGWQHPEITVARIQIEGEEYATPNFKKTPWNLTGEINVNGRGAGVVEVCYLEERSKKDGVLFLKEERILINAIADQMGKVTERKHIEEHNRKSLREKEVLLQEIHHRVKNNMQVISSLLNLQSRYIKDKQMLEMLKDNQNRIKSMSLIHEKLYQSKDLTSIDCKKYIKTLTGDLFWSYRVRSGGINLKIDVEKVLLGIEPAIPCGLIINELVTNALKHAFPEGREGEIKVMVRSIGKDKIELTVSDDGIGMPKDLNLTSPTTLGLQLIKMLAEDQLHGKIRLDRSQGTEMQIRFRVIGNE